MPYQNLYPIEPLPTTGRLIIMARPRGGDWLHDEIRTLRAAGVNVLISLLTPAEIHELDLTQEPHYCALEGILYHSFPIPDRHVPPNIPATLTLLNQILAHLQQGQHVALHCRMGLGRVTLIAAATLILLGHIPQHALTLITTARGHEVPDTDQQRLWIMNFPHHLPSLN